MADVKSVLITRDLQRIKDHVKRQLVKQGKAWKQTVTVNHVMITRNCQVIKNCVWMWQLAVVGQLKVF